MATMAQFHMETMNYLKHELFNKPVCCFRIIHSGSHTLTLTLVNSLRANFQTSNPCFYSLSIIPDMQDDMYGSMKCCAEVNMKTKTFEQKIMKKILFFNFTDFFCRNLT